MKAKKKILIHNILEEIREGVRYQERLDSIDLLKDILGITDYSLDSQFDNPLDQLDELITPEPTK